MRTDLTTYIGREHELDKAKALLGVAPLVTLIGPGGVGKTRLAGRIVAASRAAFRDGVAFVELAELRSERLLANTVADELGLYDKAERAALDVITEHLAERDRFLLVLDNCEHIVHACAEFVAALVAACPRLTVLTTSRQSLGVPGEQLFPVPPMAFPDVGAGSLADVIGFDAVRLFVDRAKAVTPSFQVTEANYRDVAALCRDLDGLPLAIELAAVRLRSLSLSQIRDRLTSRLSLLTQGKRLGPQRQSTLRSLIDWSYELCSRPERLVLDRASVFSGGFDIDAAEHVCGGEGVDRADVLDVVHGLLDKSLLIGEDDDGAFRYQLLNTVREYAKDQLDQSGDTARVARRHRDWYARLATQFADGWMGGDQVALIRRVDRDWANLWAAIDFSATKPGEAVVALRMATQLDIYWSMRGSFALNRESFARLTENLTTAPEDLPEHVSALRLAGWRSLAVGDVDKAIATLLTGRDIASRIGDELGGAYVDVGLGLAHLFAGQAEVAREELAGALAVFVRRGVGAGYAGFIHGLATAVSGDFAGGRELVREFIAASEAIGETYWRTWGLWALGMIELFYGDVDTAERLEREAYELHLVLQDRAVEAYIVHVSAAIAARKGQWQRSATLSGIARTKWRLLGADPIRFGVFASTIIGFEEGAFSELGSETYRAHRRAGQAMSREDATSYILGESVSTPVLTSRNDSPLTKRETEIAGLIAQGLTNREIAAKLVIAQRTAETHVENILGKLGFNSRAQVAAWMAARS